MTTISKTIRRFMVEFPDRLREIILTDSELCAFQTIAHYSRADPFRACQIWDEKYPQQKSDMLAKLYKKGYVDRRQVIAASGGYEYEYWPVEGLVKEKEIG